MAKRPEPIKLGLVGACDDRRVLGFPLWPKQREIIASVEAGPRLHVWALGRRSLAAERASPLRPIAGLAAAAALAMGGTVADPEGPCSAPTKAVEPYAGVLHGRPVLWEAAYKAALDRPVGGSGADTYGLASAPYQEGEDVLYAHNLPLELWAELGLAGAAAAIALYAAVGAALTHARRRSAFWLAGPAVAAFMLANLVDFPWHLAGAGAVWALALGVLIAAGRSSTDAPAERVADARAAG